MDLVQEVDKTVAMDLGALLDATDDAVVTLVAGDTRLVAHRAVLAARSPVFAAMFQHDTLAASSGQVSIPEVEGPVLRQLVVYLYTLQAPQLPSMAPQLLAAADKYGVSVLKAECERQVAAQLSVETAAATAVLAVRHSCTQLRQAATAFVRAHTHQVMSTQGWADAVIDHPHAVVEFTRLIAESSAEISVRESAESKTTPGSQEHSELSRTPASAAPPMAACHNHPPDGTTVSSMKHLPIEEKNSRLLLAAEQGAVETLRILLAAGADVGAREDYRESTALHLAAGEGHLEAVRCLLDNGADVAARDRCPETALHDAARCGHAAVVRLLLASSADPNARGQNGWTPLHWAVDHRRVQVATVLLEAGADSEVKNDSGETPLDLAKKNNNQQMVHILTSTPSSKTSVK